MRAPVLDVFLLARVALVALVLSACGGSGDRGLVLDPSGSARSVPRIWTFAVGVSSYRDTGLNLEFAARDAEAIDRFFASDMGGAVPPSRRVLLTDERATRAEILGAFEKMARLLAKDDLLVVFLAMHGVVTDRGDLYFVAHDTVPDNIRGTGLANADVEQAIRDADVKHVLLAADACHSGGVGLSGRRGMASLETNRLLASLARAKPSVAILSASRGAELSQENARWGGGHGVFTHFLLQGLAGGADDDGDRLVTVSELYDFVYAGVKESTQGAQHPELKGRFENALPIAALDGPPKRSPDPKRSPAPAVQPEQPAPDSTLPLDIVVLDLAAADRGTLEAAVARGSVAVVSYRARSLKVLPSCHVPGSYEFQSRTSSSTITATSSEDLDRYFPLNGARFAGALKANGHVVTDLLQGGYFSAHDYLAERGSLSGACAGATHVLRELIVGAFTVRSSDELLDAAGDKKACADDKQQQCRIALRVSMAPLR